MFQPLRRLHSFSLCMEVYVAGLQPIFTHTLPNLRAHSAKRKCCQQSTCRYPALPVSFSVFFFPAIFIPLCLGQPYTQVHAHTCTYMVRTSDPDQRRGGVRITAASTKAHLKMHPESPQPLKHRRRRRLILIIHPSPELTVPDRSSTDSPPTLSAPPNTPPCTLHKRKQAHQRQPMTMRTAHTCRRTLHPVLPHERAAVGRLHVHPQPAGRLHHSQTHQGALQVRGLVSQTSRLPPLRLVVRPVNTRKMFLHQTATSTSTLKVTQQMDPRHTGSWAA